MFIDNLTDYIQNGFTILKSHVGNCNHTKSLSIKQKIFACKYNCFNVNNSLF